MFLKYIGGPICVFALVAAIPVCAQDSALPLLNEAKPILPATRRLPAVEVPGCQQGKPADLSLHSRFCFYAKNLASTGGLIRALAGGGYSEWTGSPRDFRRDPGEFATHMEYFYSRRAANDAGELIAGYFNREPLLYQASGKTSLWERSRSAFISVVEVRDDDGSRVAIAPLAGSLGSGLVTLACCGDHRTVHDALLRSGVTYAGYFATALFREFKPDLKAYARRKFHR
jgi:hypothetical protein